MDESEAALICRALGDPNRLKIVKILTDGERCACRLLEDLEINHSTLSHHMGVLSRCNLIKTRKDGKWCYYALNCETLTDFRELIGTLNCDKRKCGCCKK